MVDAEPRGEQGGGWRAIRKRVLDRDGHACRFCGTSNEEHREEHDTGLHVHHIIPEGEGGEDTPENLITVCCGCHRTLENTHAKAVAQIERERSGETARAKASATYAVRRAWGEADHVDEALAEFSEQHPTFARRFGLYNEGGDTDMIDSHSLRSMVGDISSEWAFCVNFGFKLGVIETAGYIEAPTPDVIDDDALAESNLPDPKPSDR